jgi:RNA polymerase sigma-70 factor, ECF subfamily
MNEISNARDDPRVLSAAPVGEKVEKSFDPDALAQLAPPGTGYGGGTPPGRLSDEQPSDEQLLDQARKGDQASFARLVERYQRELFHFLVRFLGDRAAAEDMFQETFLQVHQSAGHFDIQRRFRPWLFTIAANKARDLIRSNSRRPVNALEAAIGRDEEQSGRFIDWMTSTTVLPEEALEHTELAQRVRSVVLQMPDSLREILLLAYFDQFPYKQIGDILQIPLGTVKSRLHTAVADFANRWKMLNKSDSPS